MTELYQINVKLSEGQKGKLAKAYRDNEEVSIRLAHSDLSGSDTLMVPKNTVKRVVQSKVLGKGVQIKITKANVRKQTGSGIFTSLLPVLRNVAPTIGKTAGLSALAGLASEGASQLLKKITGGQIFRVPNQHLFRFAMLGELLNKGQIRDLGRAHKDGSDMLFKITQKQVGNSIGTILASISVPMIMDAIKGISGRGYKGRGGSRMGKTGGAGPRIGMPMYPPPYIGTWPSTSGRGKKKDQRARSTTREKQFIQGNTNSVRHIIRPMFQKTVPMSNFDLLEWC